MANPLENFLLSVTFFSRIPLPESLGGRISHEAKLTHAVGMFPVAGLVVAILPILVWAIASLALPATVSAILAVTASLILTGALHEDGLADCADGLGATRDKEKALEIMRDSRIGTFGALALVSSVLVRCAALATLSTGGGVVAILLAHSASRGAISIAMRLSQYARTEGLGKMASGTISDVAFASALGIPLLLALLLGGFSGGLSVVIGFAMVWLILKYLEHRLGGYTGDGLGAMQQICEITVLIALAGFWS